MVENSTWCIAPRLLHAFFENEVYATWAILDLLCTHNHHIHLLDYVWPKGSDDEDQIFPLTEKVRYS